jgi:hypothetical protein
MKWVDDSGDWFELDALECGEVFFQTNCGEPVILSVEQVKEVRKFLQEQLKRTGHR